MPRLPLPPPLMMIPGSFAYRTLTQRWTGVIQRVIAENNFSAAIENDLALLKQELLTGKVRSFQDTGALDWTQWESWLQPYLNQPWLEIPWFFAEVYFYRRLLEATRYFETPLAQQIDPFATQKRDRWDVLEDVQVASSHMNQIQAKYVHTGEWDMADLGALLHSALWGNRADLSLRPAATATSVQTELKTRTEQSHILVDHTPNVLQHIATLHKTRIDLIADNAGVELFRDFCLVDFLLTHPIANTIHLHLKAHPTFVSDATIRDAEAMLNRLEANQSLEVRKFATRLKDYLSRGQLQLQDDGFWTAPLMFWEMPQCLQADLTQASLVLIKGDANYRRLLGDRHWAFTTPFADIIDSFPAAFAAIRTLKSEVAAGLEASQIEKLNGKDPSWLTNGKWGVIQFVEPTPT